MSNISSQLGRSVLAGRGDESINSPRLCAQENQRSAAQHRDRSDQEAQRDWLTEESDPAAAPEPARLAERCGAGRFHRGRRCTKSRSQFPKQGLRTRRVADARGSKFHERNITRLAAQPRVPRGENSRPSRAAGATSFAAQRINAPAIPAPSIRRAARAAARSGREIPRSATSPARPAANASCFSHRVVHFSERPEIIVACTARRSSSARCPR